MSQNSTITVRVDKQLKEDAGAILEALGTNTSAAITMFLTQVIAHRGLPFDVTLAAETSDDLWSSPGMMVAYGGDLEKLKADLERISATSNFRSTDEVFDRIYAELDDHQKLAKAA